MGVGGSSWLQVATRGKGGGGNSVLRLVSRSFVICQEVKEMLQTD